MDKTNTFTSYTSVGNDDVFECEVFLESRKMKELPKEVVNDMSYRMLDYVRQIQDMINFKWVQTFKQEERQEHVEVLKKLFVEAGISPIYVEVIDNQYSSDPLYFSLPWLKVSTSKGIIVIGWRNRVINLDWSNSDITFKGRELFDGEKTTIGEDYIHCWTEDKAVEYLKKLFS